MVELLQPGKSQDYNNKKVKSDNRLSSKEDKAGVMELTVTQEIWEENR